MLCFDESAVVSIVFLTLLGNNKPRDRLVPVELSHDSQNVRSFGPINLNEDKEDWELIWLMASLAIAVCSLVQLVLSGTTSRALRITAFSHKSEEEHNMIWPRLIDSGNQPYVLLGIGHIDYIRYQ